MGFGGHNSPTFFWHALSFFPQVKALLLLPAFHKALIYFILFFLVVGRI